MLLVALVAGLMAGAVPATGARHRHARLVATKMHARGRVPTRTPRPPLTGTLPAQTTPAATQPTTTTPAPTCPAALGVTEGEYYTHPSRTTLCPGAVVMELRNAGEDPHDLRVINTATGTTVADWDTTAPGASSQRHVTLAAGTYELFCTLTDGTTSHYDRGMHATISVG